tara:strand:+ start:444 stop:671 length:228 start_codon:yes stop_codon:yes gene_type:complete
MANMSYCRFENTAKDLADCVNALQNNDLHERMSIHEVNGLAELQLLAMDIVAMQDHIGNIIDKERGRFEAHELTN